MSRKTEQSQGIDRSVGSAIRRCRLRRGLSQQELAARLGISYQQLHKYENGSNSASAGRLSDIARQLQVAPADFFEDIGEEASPPQRDTAEREQMLLARYYSNITDEGCRMALRDFIGRLALCQTLRAD